MDLQPGEVLDGAFRIEEKIGEGGMGMVYRATQLPQAQRVAVKALVRLSPELIERFEREALTLRDLDHPGLVKFRGAGRVRGAPWLAMSWANGQSLKQLMAAHGGRLTPAQVMPIARQLLATLGYLHARGLIHRDVKPNNIHVDDAGRATLFDLGLARGYSTELTGQGVLLGTPDFMAPEQISGARNLDGRVDLYAMSVMLYRLLSGQSPFPGATELERMKAHLGRARPDISWAVPGLSSDLGAVLMKGMAIHPEDRFQTAGEMLSALDLVIAEDATEVEQHVLPRGEREAKTAPQPRPAPRRVPGEPRTASLRKPTQETTPVVEVAPAPTTPVLPALAEEADVAARPTHRVGFPALPGGGGLDEPSDAGTQPEGFVALPPLREGGTDTAPAANRQSVPFLWAAAAGAVLLAGGLLLGWLLGRAG